MFVAGHDWGAIVAWQLCLLRPDLVKALVNLSVEYRPRQPGRSPLQTIRAACGDDHYMCRFQVGKPVNFCPDCIRQNQWFYELCSLSRQH